jgi:hypothetical protein
MSWKLATRLFTVIAVVAALASPAVATASNPSFGVKTRNGYRVSVHGSGADVSVSVARGHRLAFTTYVARGTATANRVRASFGRFGRISVRFRPSANRTWETRHRRCRGAHRFVVRNGVFVGHIDFRGEGGYVSVHSRRAKGKVRELAAKCKRGRRRASDLRSIHLPPSAGEPEPPVLSASWREGLRSAGFTAIRGRKAIFAAFSEESHGRVAISRLAASLGSPVRRFNVDDAFTFARAAPPAPFSGTGVYLAAPEGTRTWTGSLSVDFLGANDFPLTGPPFKVTLEPLPPLFFPFGWGVGGVPPVDGTPFSLAR